MLHHEKMPRTAIQAAILLVMAVQFSACAAPTPDQTATATSTSTPTEAAPARLIVEVPPGGPATIDGTISAGEWEAAMEIEIDESRRILLMHSDGYLYVGIDSRSMGYGSICVAADDEISILHSSAALGTAIYQRDDQGWRRIRQFTWCCRETSPGPRQEQHLQEEGWLASIVYMGLAAEMEYQIVMPEGGLTMAVVHQTGESVTSALRWPETLDDDCLGLVGIHDDPPVRLDFSPETWPLFLAAEE